MTNLLINSSEMPPLQGTIVVQDLLRPRATSPVLYNAEPIPTKSPRASEARVAPPTPLEAKLFDNAATLKVALSEIAMHLTPEWHATIFRQVDALLDFDNWQDDSAFVQRSAFMTFLRFIIFAAPARLPCLGVDQTGHLLAAWYNGAQRIAVEFFPDDKVAATFMKQGPRGKETATWRGPVASLKPFIEQFGITECMYGNRT
ncbi:MAG: hypothetical protein ACREO5_00755 [Candidatus Binatia bacterium]